jgi:plasmid maintenance system antidote protein VapI
MAQSIEHDWYLADWMQTLNVNQADLRRQTGWPKAKMSELVNGVSRYNRDVINALAKAMNLYPYELLMHPQDAFAIRKIRETVVAVAAEKPKLDKGQAA